MMKRFQDWIDQRVPDYAAAYGRCKHFAILMLENFPELRLAAGYYLDAAWGEREHWWCVAPDGTIIDPTAKQHPSNGHGKYREVDPTKPPLRVSQVPTPYAFRCDYCGKVFMTEEEYTRQMGRINSTWSCPRCGCGDGYFDDKNFEDFLEVREGRDGDND